VIFGSVCSGMEAASLKACTLCGESKRLEDFHRNKHGPGGRHSWCRGCFNARAKSVRKRDYSPEQKRKWLLSTRYGLTPEAFDAMLVKQGGACAICTEALSAPRVDHCHTTGKVRGLLCHACNIRLSGLEDAEFQRAARAYLDKAE